VLPNTTPIHSSGADDPLFEVSPLDAGTIPLDRFPDLLGFSDSGPISGGFQNGTIFWLNYVALEFLQI